jgi:hypothetical protein
MPVKPLRILVVTGSRALDVDTPSRAWGRRTVAMALTVKMEVGLVVHGDAVGPDRWAEDLASYLLLPRVVFPLVAPGRPVSRSGSRARATRDADRYTYDASAPLTRNAAMMRWAADRAAEGHQVEVLALTAPWSTTRGTRHTVERARELELPVMHFDAPDDVWPREDGGGGC